MPLVAMHVLERERHAGERPERARPPRAARRRARGRGQRALGVDVQERVHAGRRRRRSGRGAPGSTSTARGLARRRRPRRSRRRVSRVRSAHCSCLLLQDPRHAEPAVLGGGRAGQRLAPGSGRARTSSARITLVSGSACEVGGMSSAATSATRATAARITSSWPAKWSSSSSVEREPGQPRQVRDLVAGDRHARVLGHARSRTAACGGGRDARTAGRDGPPQPSSGAWLDAVGRRSARAGVASAGVRDAARLARATRGGLVAPGSGRLMCQPWATVAAECVAAAASVAAVSTPSATTRSPRAWARSTIERTIARVVGVRASAGARTSGRP